MKSFCITMILLILVFCASGCASYVARWVEPAPPYDTGIYRGVRMYVHEIKSDYSPKKSVNGPSEGDEPTFIEPTLIHVGRGQDCMWAIVGVFALVDIVVLTPVCDTLLLPYDIISGFTQKTSPEQQ